MINWIKNLFAKKEMNEKEQIESELKKRLKSVELIYIKRKDVFGNPIPMNVCDFVRKSKTLKNNLSVKDIWNIPITYITDNFEINGVMDEWQFAEETEILKAGDCEDSGAYRHTLANNSNQQNIFSCIGFFNGNGHYFNCMIDLAVLKNVGFEQSILILEPTSSSYAPQPYINVKDKYSIIYILNENVCFYNNGTATKLNKEFNLVKK